MEKCGNISTDEVIIDEFVLGCVWNENKPRNGNSHLYISIGLDVKYYVNIYVDGSEQKATIYRNWRAKCCYKAKELTFYDDSMYGPLSVAK